MATGFRPKYERTIELAGYSSEELMLLAIEASKSLGWQAGSIKRDKSDCYSFCNRREGRTTSCYKHMHIHAVHGLGKEQAEP